MSGQAAAELQAIEQLLSEPDPSPPAREAHRPVEVKDDGKFGGMVKPKKRRVEPDDDFEGDDPAIEGDDSPVVAPVPMARPRVSGLPAIEDDEVLRKGRANIARLSAELEAAKAKLDEAAAVVGLRPGQFNPAKLDKVAAELHVAGRPTDMVDEFETRAKHVRRLTAAVEMATAALTPVYDEARRRLQPQAVAAMVPTLRDALLRYIDFLKANTAHRRAIDAARMAGFDVSAVGAFGTVTTDLTAARTRFAGFIKDGVLKPEDIADLPQY